MTDQAEHVLPTVLSTGTDIDKPGDENIPDHEVDELDEGGRGSAISDEGYRTAERDLLGILTGHAKRNESDSKVIQIGLDPLPHLAGSDDDQRFWFRVRMIDENDDDKARETATTYKKNRRLGGLKQQDDFDPVKYRSMLIVDATVEFLEPKGFDAQGDPTGFEAAEENMWKSKRVREALGVAENWQIVDKVMKPGDKERVIGKIEELAGFGLDVRDTVKK